MEKKNIIKIALAVILTILLVKFLLSQIKNLDILTYLLKIPLAWFLASFFFYFLNYFFKTLRFYVMLKKKFSLKDLFSIVCLHNFYNSVLPMRVGELSYIYFLKKKGIKGSEALSSLLISRVADFFAVFIIFLFAVIVLKGIPPFYISFFSILSIILLSFLVLFFIVLKLRKKLIVLIKWIIKKLKIGEAKTTKFLVSKTKELFTDFMDTPLKTHLNVMVFSVLCFLSQFLFFYCLLRGMGINLGFLYVSIGVIFADLAILLPLQGMVGFGTIEGMWAIAFFYLGVSKDLAITSGFVQHIVTILFFLIFGLYGWITLKNVKRIDAE